MYDMTHRTRNKPRRHIVKDLPDANSVRIWRSSPEDITLQIRLENQYVRVALTLEEAGQMARSLLRAVEESNNIAQNFRISS